MELALWQRVLRADSAGLSIEEQFKLFERAFERDLTLHAGLKKMELASIVAIAQREVAVKFDELVVDTKVQFAISIDRLIHKAYWSEDWYWACYPKIPFGEYPADYVYS